MGVISDGGCVVTPKKRKLQEALDQIQEVCQSHGVHWRLEKIIGEEDGGVGTLAAIMRGYKARGAVVMEPTGLQVVTTGAGCQNFRIRVAGKAAHGALRGEGVSAIEKSIVILSALDSFE